MEEGKTERRFQLKWSVHPGEVETWPVLWVHGHPQGKGRDADCIA